MYPDLLVKVPANHLTKPASFIEKALAFNPLQILVGTGGMIARGGHLGVTQDHLVFEPHALNLNTQESRIAIPFTELTGLRKHKRMAAVLLTATTTAGIDFEFVCWKRDAVIEAVRQQYPQIAASE